MKLEFPYKPGDIVTIFADWEKEESPIGTAKLVSLHKQGRTFILEDTYPEVDQIVYNYEEWLVEDMQPLDEIKNNKDHPLFLTYWLGNGIHKIRYVDTIGIANSTADEEDDKDINKLPTDSFIEIFGIEVY